MISGPLANNEPSLELKELLRNLRYETTKLIDTYERIVDMGLHEGFSEKEIKDMVRSELKGVMTRHEIYYLFNKEKINQKSNENYQKTKMLINQQIEDKKDTEQSSNYDVNITSKPKVIDVETQNMNIKNLENKNTAGDVKEITHQFEAHQNTMKAITQAGFDIDKGITIIKGNMSQVLYQLEAYKQQDIREVLILLQKVS